MDNCGTISQDRSKKLDKEMDAISKVFQYMDQIKLDDTKDNVQRLKELGRIAKNGI